MGKLDGIEPLGRQDDEQAFRVTFRGQPAIVFHNATKQLSRCTECKFNKGSCEHVQMLEMNLEIQEHDCDWLAYISVAIDRQNTTNIRKFWIWFTDGIALKYIHNKKDYEDILINVINRKLERMNIYECGYLTLTVPAEIKALEEFFHPNWYNGQEWLYDSEAIYVLMQTGEYVCNDEQNELLRQSIEKSKSISIV